jgi:hypothetical protein
MPVSIISIRSGTAIETHDKKAFNSIKTNSEIPHTRKEVHATKQSRMHSSLKSTFKSPEIPEHFRDSGNAALNFIMNDINEATTPEKKINLLEKISKNNLEKGVAGIIYNVTAKDEYIKWKSPVDENTYRQCAKILSQILFGKSRVPKAKDYTSFTKLITEKINTAYEELKNNTSSS